MTSKEGRENQSPPWLKWKQCQTKRIKSTRWSGRSLWSSVQRQETEARLAPDLSPKCITVYVNKWMFTCVVKCFECLWRLEKFCLTLFRSQAAKLRRPTLCFCLFLLILCHLSPWLPIELYGKKLWNLAHWSGTVSLFLSSSFMSPL